MAKLSADEIRSRFGFAYNEKHASDNSGYDTKHGGRSDGAIFDVNTGEYIGSIDNFSAKTGKSLGERAQGIDSFEKVEDYAVENELGNKRKKWNSMNDVSGAVNDIILSEEAPVEEAIPERRPPVVLSDRAAEAIAGTKAYEDVMLPRQGDYTIKNDQSVVSDFDNQFKLNLARAKAPQPQEPAALQNAESESMQYANNYKKAVADTLVPNNSKLFN